MENSMEKERLVIEGVKKKVRDFLYSAQNHSIGYGYKGVYPNESGYIGLLRQFVRPLDSAEKNLLNVACEELIKDGDIKVEKEETEELTKVTLTNDAILKYFH